MEVYYLTEDCIEVPGHVCSDCADPEFARLRHVFFEKKSHTFSNISSTSEWQDAIENDYVEIIPNVHGSLQSTPQEGPGNGDLMSTFTLNDFVATFFDPVFSDNCEFYNALQKLRNRKFGFVTDSKIYVSDKPVVILPAMNIEDNDATTIEWNVQVKWRSRNLPCGSEIPANIFECFAEEEE